MQIARHWRTKATRYRLSNLRRFAQANHVEPTPKQNKTISATAASNQHPRQAVRAAIAISR